MRISDWSSDVCSSDLPARREQVADGQVGARAVIEGGVCVGAGRGGSGGVVGHRRVRLHIRSASCAAPPCPPSNSPPRQARRPCPARTDHRKTTPPPNLERPAYRARVSTNV